MKPLFPMLLLITYLHGVFASGFIPILNEQLGERANWAFAMYFVGLLLGQIAVYYFSSLSKHRYLFTFYEILFALSFVYMGLFKGEMHLVIGRSLEGLAGGLATPLLFTSFISAPSSLPPKDRIVRYNALFALGYVTGPVIVEWTLNVFRNYAYTVFLLYFGLIFIAINLLMMPMLKKLDTHQNEEELRFKVLFEGHGWFEKFYSLFFTKCFYGFLMAFITAYAASFFTKWPISAITVLIAIIFVAGQQLGARTLHFFNKKSLEIMLPLAMGALLVVFWLTHSSILLLVVAALHAYLTFIAFLNFTTQMKSGREFALFNSMSDPGMIIGALLVGAGTHGVWVIAALGALPLLYWRQWPHLLKQAEPQAQETH